MQKILFILSCFLLIFSLFIFTYLQKKLINFKNQQIVFYSVKNDFILVIQKFQQDIIKICGVLIFILLVKCIRTALFCRITCDGHVRQQAECGAPGLQVAGLHRPQHMQETSLDARYIKLDDIA